MDKDEVAGKLKEAEGRLTNDKQRERQGELEQARAKAGQAADEVAAAIGKARGA